MVFQIQLATLLLVLLLNNEANTETYVTMYKDSSYRGENLTFGNLDHVTKISMDSMNDKMTSYKIISGSCAVMYIDNNDPPRQEAGKHFASMSDDPNVGSQYSDKISSISRCGTNSKIIQCPAGQFVKKISWSATNSLRTGIEIHCYQPKSATQSSSHRTHGIGSLANNGQCTVFRGIQFFRDTKRNAHSSITKKCTQTSSSGYIYGCGPNQALVGLNLQIENFFNFVKGSSIICRDIENIETICTAKDKLCVMFSCDARKETELLRCSFNGTRGYGLAKSQTTDQRTEHEFYQEFGFNLSTVVDGLFENFRDKLRTSNTTGYDWSVPSADAFEPEGKISMSARAAPGCITQIMEVVGECSFMEVRPLHLERVDNCSGSVFVNEINVPKSFIRNGMNANNRNGPIEFLSDIPDDVAKFLDKMKQKVF